ncbi:MAG: universal stress protein [Anaerolineae bacterium]
MADTELFKRRAREDYNRAKRAASMRRLWSSVTGQNINLIPFEDLKKTVGLVSQRYRGVQPVPVDKIIGSLNRSEDFDRAFLPTQYHSRVKWVSVDSAHLGGISLPPVSLYRVGDAYFVVDGHHRVSVARQQGQTFIDAEVIEVQSRVPVTADLRLDDLDVLGAYRQFLEQTKLDVLRPDADVRLTMPGNYAKLLDHIRVHKYYAEIEQSTELDWEQAVAHWYDTVYLPLVLTVRRNRVLDEFPGHTEADLYLWIIEHAYYLSQKLGQQPASLEVAKDYVRRFGKRQGRLANRMFRAVRERFVPDSFEPGPPPGMWREERVESGESPHLFRDILVTVTGAESGWLALSQAAEIARKEESVLRGLHVAPSDDEQALAYGRQVLQDFSFRCTSLGVKSTTSMATGPVDQEIVEHARWSDLVVINQRKVHGRWTHRPLGTIFQTVAAQAARPILAVPGAEVTPLRKVVLGYDGSPKAREALFVLRHLITCWHVEGSILAVESTRTNRESLDQAWEYVNQCGCAEVATRFEEGPVAETILRVMAEQEADLLLLGGYGYGPLIKAVLGSTVDRVLREAWFPVLICR